MMASDVLSVMIKMVMIIMYAQGRTRWGRVFLGSFGGPMIDAQVQQTSGILSTGNPVDLNDRHELGASGLYVEDS
jgi:hypothetical protein